MSLSTALTETPVILQDHDPGGDLAHPIVRKDMSTPNNFGSTAFLPQGSLDFEDTMVWEEKSRLFGTDSDFESTFDFATDHGYSNPEHNRSASDPTHNLGFSPMKTLLDLEPNAESTKSAQFPREMEVDALPPLVSHQAYVQHVSKLNIDLYEQVKVTGVATTKSPLDGCLFFKPQNEKDTSRLIGIMIHGLQTFHKVLRGIVDSQSTIHSKASTSPDSVAQSPIWQYLNTPTSPQAGSTHAENSSNALSALPQQQASPIDSDNSNTTTPQEMELDLPISLLVMSCYMNLVQLCCNVVVSIRCILATNDSQSIFAALSSELQICGVSLKQDSELQIMLLVQVVIRLLDQIEALLGCSFEERRGDEDKGWRSVISPQLLHSLLEGRKPNEGKPGKALREEIQKLNKIIGKRA